MNVLLLGFAFALPYHVMRCAVAAGHQITVLGNGPVEALLRSPRCTDLYLSDFDHRAHDYRILVHEIEHLSIVLGLDLVMPSDMVSTRALAAIRHEITLPTTLLPRVDTFDTLHGSESFMRFCIEHGVPFAAETGGKTLRITALCRKGSILAHAVDEPDAYEFRIADRPDLVNATARLVAASGFNGVLHCSAPINPATGLCELIDCRPGFSPSIHPTMIAGLNFADAAIHVPKTAIPPLPPTRIKLYPAARRAQMTPWRMSRLDRQMLRYHRCEPELLRMERRNLVDDSDVFVRSVEHLPPAMDRMAG